MQSVSEYSWRSSRRATRVVGYCLFRHDNFWQPAAAPRRTNKKKPPDRPAPLATMAGRHAVGAPVAKPDDSVTDMPAKSELDRLFRELMDG